MGTKYSHTFHSQCILHWVTLICTDLLYSGLIRDSTCSQTSLVTFIIIIFILTTAYLTLRKFDLQAKSWRWGWRINHCLIHFSGVMSPTPKSHGTPVRSLGFHCDEALSWLWGWTTLYTLRPSCCCSTIP